MGGHPSLKPLLLIHGHGKKKRRGGVFIIKFWFALQIFFSVCLFAEGDKTLLLPDLFKPQRFSPQKKLRCSHKGVPQESGYVPHMQAVLRQPEGS